MKDFLLRTEVRNVLANMTKHDLEISICDLDLPLMTLPT